MFVPGLGSWNIGLVTSALDLSSGSWAFSPASFLMRYYVCFWTWKLGRWTCHSSIRLVFWKLDRINYVCFWTWKLERWTCHSSIGLVFWKLGLRPSFILKRKLCLFLDLEAGTLDLLHQHWTCLLEAGPDKLCLFLDLHAETLHLSFQHWTYHSKAQLQS